MTNIKAASTTKSIPGMPVDIGGMTYEKMAKSLYRQLLMKGFK